MSKKTVKVLRLGELLQARGVRHCDLARKIGVDRVTVSNLANDKQYPSMATLLAIAQALEVKPWELFAGYEKEAPSSFFAFVQDGETTYTAKDRETLKEIAGRL